MTARKKIVIISCIAVISTILCIFIGAAIDLRSSLVAYYARADENNYSPGLVMSSEETNGIVLTMLADETVATTETDAPCIVKTVTATVLPENAQYKLVSWSLDWAEGAARAEEDISSYLTVTTESYGSCTATLTCLQPFLGDNIVLTAKTIVGDYSATATVTYLGLPENMHFTNSVIDDTYKVYDEYWGVDIYEIPSGSTGYIFKFNPVNAFGDVNPAVCNFEIKVQTIGDIVAGRLDASGEMVSDSIIDAVFKITQGESVATNSKYYSYTVHANLDYPESNLKMQACQVWLFTSEDSNYGNFVIYCDNSIEDWVFTDFSNSFKFAGSNGHEPYYKITIIEKNTGISESFNFRVVTGVDSVSLDASEIVY